MSGMILKVQYKDELRRVAIDTNLTMAALTERVRNMFPQLPEQFGFRCADFQIISEEDLQTAIAMSQDKIPPLLRLVVTETQPAVPFIPAELLKLSDSLPLFASCVACRKPLGKSYFKCLNCLSYELCLDCEASCDHDHTHLLVKLRMPVDQLPLKQQLIFKSHITDRTERMVARDAKRQLRAKKSGMAAVKKEERRRERAMKKLRRMEQKLETRKTKAEAKKKQRQQKVKKVKKVVPAAQAAAAVEPIVAPATGAESSTTASAFFEIPAVRPTLPAVSSCPTSPAFNDKKEEFNIFRLMAEFQLLKEDKKKHEQQQQPAVEQKAEEEIKVEDVKEEAREEIANISVEEVEQEETPAAGESAEGDAVEPAELGSSTESPFQRNLQVLEDMGFTDRNHNIELLVRNVGNLETTVDQLLRESAPGILKWLPFNLPL